MDSQQSQWENSRHCQKHGSTARVRRQLVVEAVGAAEPAAAAEVVAAAAAEVVAAVAAEDNSASGRQNDDSKDKPCSMPNVQSAKALLCSNSCVCSMPTSTAATANCRHNTILTIRWRTSRAR